MGLSGEAGDPSASGEGAVTDSAVAVSLLAEKGREGVWGGGRSGDYLEKTLRLRGGGGGVVVQMKVWGIDGTRLFGRNAAPKRVADQTT